jgi:hypothetical protein
VVVFLICHDKFLVVKIQPIPITIHETALFQCIFLQCALDVMTI